MTAEVPSKNPTDFCRCPPDGYAVASIGFKTFKEQIKTCVTTVDFGEVVPGTNITKCIEIKNKNNIPMLYHIHRASYVHDIYQSFHFNKYNIKINPHSSAQVKITYCPLLEYEKSFDCFSVLTRDSTEIERIYLRGFCLGTRIKCSTKKLYFIKTPNIRKNLNTFELKNISKVPATFQFDTDDSEEFFQVDILSGQIQAKKSIYITVTFNGRTEGLHYKRIAILIYKHEPILIDLVGIYNKKKDCVNDPMLLTFYPNEANSVYGAYFNDYGYSEEKNFPLKLNHSYFDFGRVLPENYGILPSNKNILVCILKNNMLHDILVKWYKDPEHIFVISPVEMNIRPDESGYFEVTFQPDLRDHIYSRTLSAQIQWKDITRPNTPVLKVSENSGEEENVPLITNLTLIGHSFPENQSWITAVEIIPPQVTFPACTPGYQSFATFMLKSDGHLPMLFKFIPPRMSNIEVKPRMGTMKYTKFFVAKLMAGEIPEVYKEEWKIEINGEPQRYCYITFQGQSAKPSIIIGKENNITFNTTLPGCQDIITVPVENTSCYHLRVTLMDKHEYFHSTPATLDLYPNEEINTEWTFNGKPDVPPQTKVHCSVRVISNSNELVGLPFEVIVAVTAECEYSQICATPRYMDFGDIPWGSSREVNFKIFNFGKSSVYYSLKAVPIIGQADVHILNAKGTLNPNDSTLVNLSFGPTKSVENVVQIIYLTRISEIAEAVTNHSPVDLFSMRFNCIHPTLQTELIIEKYHFSITNYNFQRNNQNIIRTKLYSNENVKVFEGNMIETNIVRHHLMNYPEISLSSHHNLIQECVEHNLGKIFSKLDLWHILRVNKINEQLLSVKEDETKTVELHLPYVECHEKIHRIRFLVRNITKFDLIATLSRVRMCRCQPTEITKSLSFRHKVFQCPHRTMLTMKLSDENIIGTSFQYLDIFMNFNLITDEEVAYDLKLSINRHIQFNFRMNIIPKDMQMLSAYNDTKHKILLNMFIGAKEPPYQTFWLYNNTSKPNSYQVLDAELNDINKSEGFPVFSCFNNKGIVSPFSSTVVLFRFHPIEAKKYQVTLPILLGQEKMSLKLSGRGSYKYDNNLIQKFNTKMPNMSFNNGSVPVSLSVDYMLVGAFPVWNTIERLFYMRNVSKDRITEFTWQQCFIDGVIKISADKPSGILHPEETVGVILKIKSFENPTISTINLSCRIIDITQNEINEKSIQKYAERQEFVDNFFLIDEKGTHTMENTYTIEPPSEEFYVTLAITFHTISTLEMSQYLEVDELLGLNPFESFENEINNSNLKEFNISDASEEKSPPNTYEELTCKYDPYISQIMECFIMDTLRSPVFQEMVRCQQRTTPPYYVQFTQDEPRTKAKWKKKRNAEIEKYFARPQMRKLSNAFKYLIKDSVQEIFF